MVGMLQPGQVRIKVDPVWVVMLDQVEFPVPFPFFNLLLASSCCFCRVMCFEPHQSVYTVARGEPRYSLDLVFPYSPGEFGGDTDIKGPIGFAGEKIDVKHRAVAQMDPGLRRENKTSYQSLAA